MTRSIETQTGLMVDVNVFGTKVLATIDGECYVFTRDDAARLASALTEAILEAKNNIPPSETMMTNTKPTIRINWLMKFHGGMKGRAVNQDFGAKSARYTFVNGVYGKKYGDKPAKWAISDKVAFFWKKPETRCLPKTAKK